MPNIRDIMTPKQLEILWQVSQNGTRNTMFVGGARSGKTFMTIWILIHRALKAPGSRHAILRFRANSVRASIILDTLPKVMKTFFPGVRYKDNRQDSFISFSNGSEIWYGGLDDKERAEKILGLEFVSIYFNEASQIPYSSYLIAKTRLAQVVEYEDIGAKGKKITLGQRVYVDMNPTGNGHWTYATFILKIDPISKQPLPDGDNYSAHYINPSHNAQNLTPETLADFANMPERQRKRFWLGEFVTEVQGALWTAEMLAQWRRDADDDIPDFSRVVVAIDPSGASGEQDKRSDEIGIIVAARGTDGRAYVLADRSGKFSPAAWGLRAVAAYHEFKADRIVAETNYGGAMVESTIRSADPNVAYATVTASRGKVIRAEPVAALYEMGKVSHIGFYPQLEDQMTQLTGEGFQGSGSPDRMDALVWALTELMLPTETSGQALFELERRNAAKRAIENAAIPVPTTTHAAGSVEWMMALNG